MRACKGMALRQEVYRARSAGPARERTRSTTPVRLFSAAQHNCHIRRVQPRGRNQHAVFLVTESEAVTYHYELALGGDAPLDARPAHRPHAEPSVRRLRPRDAVRDGGLRATGDTPTLRAIRRRSRPRKSTLIRAVQSESHLAYTETRFTDELSTSQIRSTTIACPRPARCARTNSPASTIAAPAARNATSARRASSTTGSTRRSTSQRPRIRRRARLPPAAAGHDASQAPGRACGARCIFKDDLSGPLALGPPGRLGLTYESYKLALTAIAARRRLHEHGPQDDFAAEARTALDAPAAHDRLLRRRLSDRRRDLPSGGAPPAVATAWWMRSGIAGFDADAALHFYLPERYIDPFGNETDARLRRRRSLRSVEHRCARQHHTVDAFDHRVLAPARFRDANDNVSEAAFDILGLPGRDGADGQGRRQRRVGDRRHGRRPAASTMLNPSPDHDRGSSSTSESLDRGTRPAGWLGTATARFVYHFGESLDAEGEFAWARPPAGACSIVRERHEGDQRTTNAARTQGIPTAGRLRVLRRRRPGLRQEGPGRARSGARRRSRALDRQRQDHRQQQGQAGPAVRAVLLEERASLRERRRPRACTPSCSTTLPGRLVRTEFPDGTLSRVEFSPWFSRSFDQNDTVLEPGNRVVCRRTRR